MRRDRRPERRDVKIGGDDRMRQFKTAVVLLCMSGLSLTGCELSHDKPLSAEAEACKARIAAFRANVGLDDVKLFRERKEIGEQTLSLTNAQERIMLFRELVKEFYKIDVSKCTDREASYMLNVYYRVSEYLAYGLRRAGCSKEEAWQALVTGIEKYRQICFSFGDENDFSDGWNPKASERRIFARGGRKAWKGCLLFCRDHTIKRVFGGDGDKETIEQLKARLQDKFGQWLAPAADGNVTNHSGIIRTRGAP